MAEKKGIRINALSKEIGVESKAILHKLKEEGLSDAAPNHMSTISFGLAASVRDWFAHAGRGTAAETAPPVEAAAATTTKTVTLAQKEAAEAAGSEAEGASPPLTGRLAEFLRSIFAWSFPRCGWTHRPFFRLRNQRRKLRRLVPLGITSPRYDDIRFLSPTGWKQIIARSCQCGRGGLTVFQNWRGKLTDNLREHGVEPDSAEARPFICDSCFNQLRYERCRACSSVMRARDNRSPEYRMLLAQSKLWAPWSDEGPANLLGANRRSTPRAHVI